MFAFQTQKYAFVTILGWKAFMQRRLEKFKFVLFFWIVNWTLPKNKEFC